MKPLIIFEFEGYDYEPEKAEKLDEYIKDQEFFKQYDIVVLWGGKARVYYPYNPFKYYYQKLKAWLILRIWKKSIS